MWLWPSWIRAPETRRSEEFRSPHDRQSCILLPFPRVFVFSSSLSFPSRDISRGLRTASRLPSLAFRRLQLLHHLGLQNWCPHCNAYARRLQPFGHVMFASDRTGVSDNCYRAEFGETRLTHGSMHSMVNHAGIPYIINARIPANVYQCVDNRLSYTYMQKRKANR